MYKNIPLLTFTTLLLLGSYVGASAQSTIDIKNRYTLDSSVKSYRFGLTDYMGSYGNYHEIRPTSTNTLTDGEATSTGALINFPSILKNSYTNAIGSDLITHIIYMADDEDKVNCTYNNLGKINFTISKEDNTNYVKCNKMIPKGAKVYSMSRIDPYVVVATNTLVVNPNYNRNIYNYHNDFAQYVIDMKNLYSKNKLEQVYNDMSSTSPRIRSVTDDWTISEGAQGLMMTKNTRTYAMENGTTKVDVFDPLTGDIKVASTTVIRNDTTTSTTTNDNIIATSTESVASTSALDIENDTEVATKKSAWDTLLEILMFWK